MRAKEAISPLCSLLSLVLLTHCASFCTRRDITMERRLGDPFRPRNRCNSFHHLQQYMKWTSDSAVCDWWHQPSGCSNFNWIKRSSRAASSLSITQSPCFMEHNTNCHRHLFHIFNIRAQLLSNCWLSLAVSPPVAADLFHRSQRNPCRIKRGQSFEHRWIRKFHFF